jgi:hypothetical protein
MFFRCFKLVEEDKLEEDVLKCYKFFETEKNNGQKRETGKR